MSDEFGRALRKLRNQAGLTQSQLADAARVADRTVRRLEAGDSPDTRNTTVQLISNALADALDREPKQLWRELVALRDGEAEPVAATSQESETVPDSLSGAVDAEGPETPAPRFRGPTRPKPALGDLRPVVDSLATTVRDRWIREEEQRRVHDPGPLPVRWHAAREGLVSHRTEAQAADQESDQPAASPSSGTLADIAQAYRSVADGRLVVLGRAGSGKTVLAVRFVVDYVDTREPDEPVPVVFGLSGWNPTAVALRDWLAHRLVRDHPELGKAGPGPGASTLAVTLLAAGWILPVLDGFDEIAENLQRAALDQLNATTLPFLLTSRTEQFQKAVEANRVLNRAVGVELDDLTVADLAGYLPDAAAGVWKPVLDAIDEHPEKKECIRLVKVLRTPLMVLLARTVYGDVPGRNPADLLKEDRFPTGEALEQHLLAGFVPALYHDAAGPVAVGDSSSAHNPASRRWPADDVARYAAHLAVHLRRSRHQGGQDLAWWELGDSVRPIWRVLAVTLAGVLVTSLAHLLVVIPVDLLSSQPYSAEPPAVLTEVFLIGPVVGLSFGLVYVLLVLSGRFTIKPSRVRIRLSWRRRRAADPTGRISFTVWAAFGFLGGTAMGCGYGLAQTLAILLVGYKGRIVLSVVVSVTLTNMAVFSLIFGLAAGLAFGLMATLTVPDDVSTASTPLSLLATNRAAALRQLVVLTPLLSLAIGLGGAGVTVVLQGPLGPLNWPLQSAVIIGASGGLIGVTMYTLTFTAWGQWLLLVRFWLPLTGRLPWATAEFLEDAYRKGLLRQSGAVYQFRHARLRDQLAALSSD